MVYPNHVHLQSESQKARQTGLYCPPITKAIKILIKNMKIDNYLWGCKRIQDELAKMSIDISRDKIRKVIQDYRNSGDIKPNYSRNKFLKAQWQSLFACDFFTVDIFGFKRCYIFFIIELKSRAFHSFCPTGVPELVCNLHRESVEEYSEVVHSIL